MDFDTLKQKVIKICNKNTGLEIPYSELPNKEWLGDVSTERCLFPIFSLETKTVTLRNGEKRNVPAKCILLNTCADDLTLLFSNDEKGLQELYDFIVHQTSRLTKIKNWLKQNWMSLTALIISLIPLIQTFLSN